MKTLRLLVSLVAVTAFVALMSTFANAAPVITGVEVNGVEHDISVPQSCSQRYSVVAGETLPIRVNVRNSVMSDPVEEDVHVSAEWREGRSLEVESEEFDVIPGNTYTRTLNVRVPTDINPSEPKRLWIVLESFKGFGTIEVCFTVQRTSHALEILHVDISEQARAGRTLPINVVIKNRGRHEAEDTRVRVSIAELGITRTVVLGDLSATDGIGNDEDEEDTLERTVNFNIPSNAPAGVYALQIEAFDDEASVVTTRQIAIGGVVDETRVIPSSTSKKIAANQKQTYTLTLVNTGNSIKVYNVDVDAPSELSVESSDSVVVVPAGSSKTVNFEVVPSEEGTHNFAVTVRSDNELVKREEFTAVVEGKATAVNPAIVLTVVLAVIFVVLVIVLIVLLTRRPERKEEFGESYY